MPSDDWTAATNPAPPDGVAQLGYTGRVSAFGGATLIAARKVRAKHINTLTAGNFCIEVVFLCHLAYDDQFFRCNFSAGYAGHYGISASILDVGQETVVAVLRRGIAFFQYHLVPQAGKDRGYGRFTQFATIALP